MQWNLGHFTTNETARNGVFLSVFPPGITVLVRDDSYFFKCLDIFCLHYDFVRNGARGRHFDWRSRKCTRFATASRNHTRNSAIFQVLRVISLGYETQSTPNFGDRALLRTTRDIDTAQKTRAAITINFRHDNSDCRHTSQVTINQMEVQIIQ